MNLINECFFYKKATGKLFLGYKSNSYIFRLFKFITLKSDVERFILDVVSFKMMNFLNFSLEIYKSQKHLEKYELSQ